MTFPAFFLNSNIIFHTMFYGQLSLSILRQLCNINKNGLFNSVEIDNLIHLIELF